MYRAFGKRLFDVVATTLAFVVLLPVFAVLMVLVRWHLGAPVFFRQQRAGKDGKAFSILKFRTMTEARDAAGHLLPDAERLPPFGVLLRSTSLDELPELINILRGEMSVVGPRPLYLRYVDRYSPEQRRRLAVRPGLTGWAQVNGRNALSWGEKFAYDLWYIEHQSFWLDLKIIGKTIYNTLRREGINAPGEATMQEFMGNES